jgi:hypothetical protein
VVMLGTMFGSLSTTSLAPINGSTLFVMPRCLQMIDGICLELCARSGRQDKPEPCSIPIANHSARRISCFKEYI